MMTLRGHGGADGDWCISFEAYDNGQAISMEEKYYMRQKLRVYPYMKMKDVLEINSRSRFWKLCKL